MGAPFVGSPHDDRRDSADGRSIERARRVVQGRTLLFLGVRTDSTYGRVFAAGVEKMVSRGALSRVIATAVVVTLAIAGLMTLARDGAGPETSDDGSLSATLRDQESPAPVGSANVAANAPDPLVATTEEGELVPPKPSRKTTGATTPSDSTPPPTTPADRAYLEQTRAVVETNAGDLTAIAQLVTGALGSGDSDALEQVLVADAGDVSELAEDLADDYPPIITSQLSGNVDVFAAEETTLYFAYALVTWTDGGLTSQHTIPIVLRFVGGEWRLSSLGQTAPGLTFVQSVEL